MESNATTNGDTVQDIFGDEEIQVVLTIKLARINEASIRIREHLATTSQPPLEQNSLALRYFATQHARDQMELNQQSPSTQPIVNSVLSTRLAAKWRMSNKLSEGDWIAALERRPHNADIPMNIPANNMEDEDHQ
ncbi:uncharacterized protein PITG_03677 [Phytophthora infestans T30-4]|uniref:Uncharacterized protein n=1 Tax=Phytophthora infestans (strain T30-4) TaxID=403677 RepID=D0MY85_PHYIT|nr:uncharacterized protein PITG_03677 [Phytophthora infestans T30-4]EEY66133.1 hypothetical protein PITG_03677 [Phytophthora infestans T30-4]|eukprot:XP_002906732.1 hypothetical protein PITG_03677 [Phytophthora infestans T30-4]